MSVNMLIDYALFIDYTYTLFEIYAFFNITFF